MIRNDVGSKFLFCYLPIKMFLNIIFTKKRWYDEFNFSIRVIIANNATIVLIINITSHTCTIALKAAMRVPLACHPLINHTIVSVHKVIVKDPFVFVFVIFVLVIGLWTVGL